MKKFALIIAFVVCMVFLGGWANYDCSYLVSNDGVYKENFAIEINREDLKNKGVTDAKIDIYINNLTTQLSSRTFKQNLFEGFYARADLLGQSAEAIKQSVQMEVSKGEDNVNVLLTFNNPNAYYCFYNISEEDLQTANEQVKKTKGLYLIVVSQSSTASSPSLTREGATSPLGKINEIVSALKISLISVNTPTLSNSEITKTYNYYTQNSRLHSDADFTFYDSGFYVHSWDKVASSDNINIILFTMEAKKDAWYITLAGAGILLVVVLWLIGIIKEEWGKNKAKAN